MKVIPFKTTEKRQVIDITGRINEEVGSEKAKEGLCHLFVLHTTTALTTADLDPGTDLDMLDAFEKLIPKLNFRHPHNPAHAPDHILSSLIGTSLLIPIQKNALLLGTWQHVVLVEFDGPRTREVAVSLI